MEWVLMAFIGATLFTFLMQGAHINVIEKRMNKLEDVLTGSQTESLLSRLGEVTEQLKRKGN